MHKTGQSIDNIRFTEDAYDGIRKRRTTPSVINCKTMGLRSVYFEDVENNIYQGLQKLLPTGIHFRPVAGCVRGASRSGKGKLENRYLTCRIKLPMVVFTNSGFKGTKSWDEGYWFPPYVHEQNAIEHAVKMADRFNRMYMRTLRKLRDFRRFSVTINRPDQVNIAAENGKQVNVVNKDGS